MLVCVFVVFVMCGCIYVWFFNVCACIFRFYSMLVCVCVCVWNLESVGACMYGFCNV